MKHARILCNLSTSKQDRPGRSGHLPSRRYKKETALRVHRKSLCGGWTDHVQNNRRSASLRCVRFGSHRSCRHSPEGGSYKPFRGFFNRADPRFISVKGNTRFILVPRDETKNGKQHIYITESDIENIITAKAAIFATMKILLRRLDLSFDDIDRFYIAGAFGNYLNVENAVTIGLIPNIDRNKVEFMGNTSIKGAKIVAFYKEALRRMEKIREHTTYDDLMGAPDYVEEFQKAMFLPHTDIEIFERD